MKDQRPLLRKILRALVDEWGYEEVSKALGGAKHSSPDSTIEAAKKNNHHRATERARLSATAQIERAELEGEKRQALSRLAERYDQKRFLPTVADVREFLTMMDQRPAPMKDRQEAFRTLLRALMCLPLERLKQLVHTEQYSGPAELGPLSDAIAAAGRQLPRGQQADHSVHPK